MEPLGRGYIEIVKMGLGSMSMASKCLTHNSRTALA